MPKFHLLVLTIVAAVLLSACSQTAMTPVESARSSSQELLFFNDPITEGPVIEQVSALNERAAELVQVSKVRGALAGLALGCGVTMASGGTPAGCVVNAVIGGASGAVIGNAMGERSVERQVELVSPNSVARNLNVATSQFASIQTALPELIARQEEQLNTLTVQLINGEITQAEHDRGVEKIEQDRRELTEALALSARTARQASSNLQEAAARGQTGLDWHFGEASQLATDVETTLNFDIESSRSAFSML